MLNSIESKTFDTYSGLTNISIECEWANYKNDAESFSSVVYLSTQQGNSVAEYFIRSKAIFKKVNNY